MIKFLKTFGKGILYVLGLPLLVAFLSVYFVISVLSFIYLTIQGIFLFFKGESLIGEMVEDKLARQRLNAMNNIEEDEDLEKYVIVENESDVKKEEKLVIEEPKVEEVSKQPQVSPLPTTPIINEVEVPTPEPVSAPAPEPMEVVPEEEIEPEFVPEPMPEPVPEPIPEPMEVKAEPFMGPIISEEEIKVEEEIPFAHKVEIEKSQVKQEEAKIEENKPAVEEIIQPRKVENQPKIEEKLPKPVNPMDEILGTKTETIDLNEADYFKHNKYIIDHDDEDEDDDSGVDFYNYDGGNR